MNIWIARCQMFVCIFKSPEGETHFKLVEGLEEKKPEPSLEIWGGSWERPWWCVGTPAAYTGGDAKQESCPQGAWLVTSTWEATLLGELAHPQLHSQRGYKDVVQPGGRPPGKGGATHPVSNKSPAPHAKAGSHVTMDWGPSLQTTSFPPLRLMES